MIDQIRVVHYLVLIYLSHKTKVPAKEILRELQSNGIHINMHKLYTLLERLEQMQLVESNLTNTTPPTKEVKILPAAEALIAQIQRMIVPRPEIIRVSEKVPQNKLDPAYRTRINNEVKSRFDQIFIGKGFESVSPTQTKLFEKFADEVANIIFRESAMAKAPPKPSALK